MGSKSGETRHNCGPAAKLRTLQHIPIVPTLSEAIGQRHSFGGSYSHLFPIFTAFTACTQRRRRTPLAIPLVSQHVASSNCRKLHIDKFFATATHSSQPHRILRQRDEFVERVADAARAGEQASKPSFLRITLA